MYPRQLLRKLPSLSLLPPLVRPRQPPRRLQSSFPQPRNTGNVKTQARAARVLDHVPRFLRRYTDGMRSAPISHVVSFLVLHELTAVIPLVGLASYFHYTNWLPAVFANNAYISAGVEKFGAYFRRKGWFGLSKDGTSPTTKRAKVWNASEAGTKIVVEVATAYAITKALLPLRLMLSVWLTPWFARVAIGRVGNRLASLGRSYRGKGFMGMAAKEKGGQNVAAGTRATGKGTSAAEKDSPRT